MVLLSARLPICVLQHSDFIPDTPHVNDGDVEEYILGAIGGRNEPKPFGRAESLYGRLGHGKTASIISVQEGLVIDLIHRSDPQSPKLLGGSNYDGQQGFDLLRPSFNDLTAVVQR